MGVVPEAPSEDDVELLDPPQLPYACDCTMADGAVCGARFATLQQLATHVRRTKSGSHGQVEDYYQAVVTNQCPWCRVVHANMRTTRQHVRRALQFKVCKGRGSPHVFQPNNPPTLCCPKCPAEFETLDALHDHVTQRFVGPWIHVD